MRGLGDLFALNADSLGFPFWMGRAGNEIGAIGNISKIRWILFIPFKDSVGDISELIFQFWLNQRNDW